MQPLRGTFSFLDIIKSQRVFWGGILPCYVLNLHFALFEVLCSFCFNNQGLLHAFGEHGSCPGSWGLMCCKTRCVHKRRLQLAFFHLKFLAPLCTELICQWEGKCSLFTSGLWWTCGNWATGLGIWAWIYASSRENRRSMTSIVSIHFMLGSYGAHWSECKIPHRESSLVSLQTISSSNRH